jgi:hypothetical protein
MSVDIPLKAAKALAALKAQSAAPKAGPHKSPPTEHYKALESMAENEPWTSHIIRAARKQQTHIRFDDLDDEWLVQLAQRLSPKSGR